jgi:hypothetical protein
MVYDPVGTEMSKAATAGNALSAGCPTAGIVEINELSTITTRVIEVARESGDWHGLSTLLCQIAELPHF